MKNQDLFSSKDKSKKLRCRLQQFLFRALRVKVFYMTIKALPGELSCRHTGLVAKGHNFHDFLFAFLEKTALPKRGLLVEERIALNGKFFL